MSAQSARQDVAERLKDLGIGRFHGQGEGFIVIPWNEMDRLIDMAITAETMRVQKLEGEVRTLTEEVRTLTEERDELILRLEEVEL